jgi:antitoxin component of RelBE/YafQ-DinJ toxin-antitoxin module
VRPKAWASHKASSYQLDMDHHIDDMFIHMKTTLTIDDTVMARLKRESARTGRTMSELVEIALRRLLQTKPDPVDLPPLPSFTSGGALVDIADREALYQAMEGR